MKQKSVKNKNVIVHNDRGDTVRLNKYILELRKSYEYG